jgi:uncharacterized protein (TIGR02145 family)
MLVILQLNLSGCKKKGTDDESITNPIVNVTDIDGNVYHSVSIGTQLWMKENLKTTKFRNGDPIPNITDDANWGNTAIGAYCNYNNDITNKDLYGCLYNWIAVSDSRNLAPSGWHVATDKDWQTLRDFLGGETIAGGKLKETGTNHWTPPNVGATDEVGFKAMPAGRRIYTGVFDSVGEFADWWTSTEYVANAEWDYSILFDESTLKNSYGKVKNFGSSVRCVKD